MQRRTDDTISPAQSFSALIADDHEFVRNCLRDELTNSFPELTHIYESDNPIEAVSQAIVQRPELVVLDIEFDNDSAMNGVDAAEQIWKEHPHAAIVVVSNYKAETYIRHLHQIISSEGSYGYVLKDRLIQDFIPAVKAVLSGDCWIEPEIMRVITRLGKRNYSLTDNEHEALVFIALGLSDQASSRILCLTEKAIQARLQLLYAKLAIPQKGDSSASYFNPRCRAIWSGFQRGLITEAELKHCAAEISHKARELGIVLPM